MPWQRGQGMYADSANAGRSRCRDNSIKPKREIEVRSSTRGSNHKIYLWVTPLERERGDREQGR